MIRFIAAIRTAVTLTALLIGGPALLVITTGPLLPPHLPSALQVQAWLQTPFDPSYAAGTVRAAAWSLWILFAAATSAVIVGRLRRWRWSRLAIYLPQPAQTLTAAVLGTAAVTTSVTSMTATPSTAATNNNPDQLDAGHTGPATVLAAGQSANPSTDHGHSTPPKAAISVTVSTATAPVTTPTDLVLAGAGHRTSGSGVRAWARHAPGGTYRVVDGDNLWDIAEAELGDPHRWREICQLNRGHVQTNGYALTDPAEIHVGWVLALPAHEIAPTVVDKEPAEPAAPTPAVPAPGGSAAASPDSGPASPAATTAAPSATVTTVGTAAPTVVSSPSEHADSHADQQTGITLPSQGWISLGLAATIAAVATLLRLHRRRRARLGAPVAVGTGPTRPPVPPELARADAAGRRHLFPHTEPVGADEPSYPAVRPMAPVPPAPIGVDACGAEVSLFALPGPGLALRGPGADAVARAVLASALATGVYDPPAVRPVVVTTPGVLSRLLPDGAAMTGLDPHGVTFDGERLIVLADTGAAVTHAEEEMIGRRRLLDTLDADTITDLNTRDDHIEHQPPYVLLIDGTHRHTGRITAVAAHRNALHLHLVVLGDLDGTTTLDVAADGTLTDGGRLATLAASDLAHLLAMVADAAARPEPGIDIDEPAEADQPDRSGEPAQAAGQAAPADLAPVPDLPAASGECPPLARLTVLGAVTLTTDAGPVTTGMRSGSYAALALLAVHPHGRTLAQISADLHPDTDPTTAAKRIRTDINTVRRVLRTATGAVKAMFVLYDAASGRYRIDPDTVEVDLWRMLTAIGTANTATDDTTVLTALREAADLYAGDFADGQDRIWVTDYATTHRHQILNVYARIAELLEPEQPDAAVAALETALHHDPVNEELYQRIIRIHGRQYRPDAVRRTLRRLETQLADLGDAEPSEATRRIADRQLRHTVTSGPRA